MVEAFNDTEQRDTAQLHLDELTIGYPQQVLCGPLNLRVEAGAGVGIIGPNGSGKSTLVRTALGTLPAISGRIRRLGLPLDDSSLDFRRNVAVQVTDGVFFEELTVAEHLEMVARGHGIDAWHDAVGTELGFFGLDGVSGHLPGELSSGQRRKLLLAAALLRPAQLLILDEPEQRLDLQARHRFYERLAGLRRERGTGILAVTHDPEMLRSCLDQAFLLDGETGRLMDAEQGARWLER